MIFFLSKTIFKLNTPKEMMDWATENRISQHIFKRKTIFVHKIAQHIMQKYHTDT